MTFIALHPDLVLLKDEEIVNRWNEIISDGAGRGEKFYEEVERGVNAAGIPDIAIERKEVDAFKPGQKIKKLATQAFLSIRGTASPIDRYTVLVGARDYGKHLLVCRYVIVQHSHDTYSVFENEEIVACFSFVHRAVLSAMELIMKDLNRDFSKVNTQSKGIIDIV